MCVVFAVFLTFILFFGSGEVLPNLGSSSRSYVNDVPLNRSYIGKVAMLYGENPVYEQALKSHERHNAVHGYSMTVLRSHILPGFWSKPGYILLRLLEEKAKPEHERLEWIV